MLSLFGELSHFLRRALTLCVNLNLFFVLVRTNRQDDLVLYGRDELILQALANAGADGAADAGGGDLCSKVQLQARRIEADLR